MEVIINDWRTWLAYSESAKVSDGAVIWTSSPSVYEALKHKMDVRDLTGHITIEEADTLGELVHEVTGKWSDILNKKGREVLPDCDIGVMLGRLLPQLLSSFFFHALELKPLIESGRPYTIPYIKTDDRNDLLHRTSRNLMPQMTNYYCLIMQAPVFQGNMALSGIDGPRKKYQETINYKPSVRERLVEFGLHVTARRSYFTTLFLKKILYKKQILGGLGTKLFESQGRVFIYKSTNQILPLIPHFIRSRFKIQDVSSPANKDRGGATGKLPFANLLFDGVRGDFEGKEYLLPGLQAAALKIDSYLNNVFLPEYAKLSSHVDRILKSSDRYPANIMLSNGVGDPIENILCHLFQNKEVPVIFFEHGAIGLLKHYWTLQKYSDMSRSKYYVSHNEYEQEFYTEVSGDGETVFVAQGAHPSVAVPYPKIAKWLMRKTWGTKRDRLVVLYAPTRFKDGHMWLPHCIQDMKYWKWMKQLTKDVFAQIDGDVIVKAHQKGMRGGAQPQYYMERRLPWEDFDTPTNVSVRYWPDFTYSRNVPDIIIVDRATSTLGWALAANIPLIYLDLPFDQLVEDVRGSMEDALFVVDVSKENWREQIQRILRLDRHELMRQWEEKSPARDAFSLRYVNGPVVPSSQVFKWVLKRAS